ncbi:recombinase family protein [Parashewanella curva]|uniref:Recombinase family protein n=1 Tax=Parashewanella curva TaxID=2338552 RepID=A0A3L8PQJ1_9GAMM|nr:recombinase family protein [Parashewanella curva]RLV57685.1 recombinase family protein [Parashewanella curva]
MKGQKIGYRRVSSFDQNESRQLENLTLDKIFTDKASGKDTERHQLKEMLAFVREGDTVYVHSMDRLARNLDDLRRVVKELISRGIDVTFVKECLTFNNQDSPMSNLLLSVMGAFAEFERELIKERQREGIELAKKRGVYKGRKKALSEAQASELKTRIANGENKSALAKEFNISRQTLYSYLPKT